MDKGVRRPLDVITAPEVATRLCVGSFAVETVTLTIGHPQIKLTSHIVVDVCVLLWSSCPVGGLHRWPIVSSLHHV